MNIQHSFAGYLETLGRYSLSMSTTVISTVFNNYLKSTSSIIMPKRKASAKTTEAKKPKGKKTSKKEEKSDTDKPVELLQEQEQVVVIPQEQESGPAPSKRAVKSPQKKNEDGKDKKKLLNRTDSKFYEIDYKYSAKNEDGKDFNFKISSWNCGGIRSLIKKNGLDYVKHENPDIFCMQEIKCAGNKRPAEAKIPGYYDYWASGTKEGYAGVALYSKVKPLNVEYGIGIKKHDEEGRVITAEYDKFYFVNAYVPNSGRGLVTLPKRLDWNEDFHKYLANLDKKKPVILSGDLNVSHLEIDLARPKSNERSAGFTKQERDGFSELLSKGFIDTFRKLYPTEEGAYTYWTYMANARAKNVGWRLDYHVISKRLLPNLCDNIIRSDVFGSDHCPLVLTMHF